MIHELTDTCMYIDNTLLRISDAYNLPEPVSYKDPDYWELKLGALMQYLGVAVDDNSQRVKSSASGRYPTSPAWKPEDGPAGMGVNVGPGGGPLLSKPSHSHWNGGAGQNVNRHENVLFPPKRNPGLSGKGMGQNVNSQGL